MDRMKRVEETTAGSSPNAAAISSGKETAGKWTVFAMVAIGIFMATLDASIVNISLPKISLSFHEPLNGTVEWVIIAYLVVIAGTLLTFGRLSDMTGRKIIWVSGLAIFTLGSALCGAAPSLPLLVAFRAIQGVGGAMIMSISPAMVTHAFPPWERGRGMGLVAMVVAAGTSAGPALGGFITETFSWRWIFLINLPIGVVAVAAAVRLLKERMRFEMGDQRFDLPGAALLSSGLIALTLAMSFGQEAGWGSRLIVGLFAVALVSFVAFMVTERRVRNPMVDLALFRNRLFSAAIASSFLSFLALFAVMFLMPFYLEELLALKPDQAGLLMTVVPIIISVVAPFSGRLSDRFGSQALSSLGLAIGSIGLWYLSNLTASATTFDIVWPLAVAGFGQALFQPPNNNAIMGSVPVNRLGVAAGFLATVRVMGQAASVALAGAIFTSLGGADAGAALTRQGPLHALAATPLQETFTHAFHVALATCMVIASIGVFTSLMRGATR